MKEKFMFPVPAGSSVLITGGSGFLGQALIEQLYRTNRVIAMARNEGNLVALKQKFPSIHILSGDVADPYSVNRVMRGGIDYVFHLAGLKHVGLAETQAYECVKTNVTGTINLLNEARVFRPYAVIATSTDKAAQVSGVYGASKLLMERLFLEAQAMNSSTKFRIVRYGNVLYSTGSVLCKWRDALQQGKPVTISDPDATRFYWSVDAAVDLLFECLAKATGAEPFVPEMKAMRLGDILMAMEEKYGRAVEVITTGLKQGENKAERILEGGLTSDQVERYTREEIFDLV